MKPLIDELAETELLLNAPRDLLERIAAHSAPRSLAPNDILLAPEQANHCVYLLLEGTLTIHLQSPDASAIREVTRGQSVGEMSVIDDAAPSAYVKAMGHCRVFPVRRDFLMSLIQDAHPVAYNLLRSLTRLMKGNTRIIVGDRLQISTLTAQANVDGLTGVYNRHWLNTSLPRLLAQMIQAEQPLSVLMLDLDHFKQFNDTHGHLRGDAALTAVSRLLKSGVRPYDFVARYGGEEFIVLLPNTTMQGGVSLAERIRKDVEEFHMVSTGGAHMSGITVSIGVAVSDANSTVKDLVAEADAQLYLAKESGRNCVRYGERQNPASRA